MGTRPRDPLNPLGVIAVVLVIVGVQLALPDSVTIGPLWLIPVLELTGIPIVLALRRVQGLATRHTRRVVDGYLVLLVAASVMNAALLLVSMLSGDETSGEYLLLSGFGVLAINVLSFGLVYWWVDGGGPLQRAHGPAGQPDFLFPQQAQGQDWHPTLLDYLFTAYTNIIAFSPTDTMPLSHRVKVLFVIQSSTAVVTIVVTLSRAINLIPGAIPGG